MKHAAHRSCTRNPWYQIEQEQRDRLHSDLAQLVVEDPRREAWFAVDNLSSQWVTAWPTAKHRLTAQEFPEVASSYLGTMSPIVRPFAGQMIPCGHGPRVCDASSLMLLLTSPSLLL